MIVLKTEMIVSGKIILFWNDYFFLGLRTFNNILTDFATYGASIPPIRAIHELAPIPAFLTTVGYNSAEKTYMTQKAPLAPSFPTMANAKVSGSRAVVMVKDKDKIVVLNLKYNAHAQIQYNLASFSLPRSIILIMFLNNSGLS